MLTRLWMLWVHPLIRRHPWVARKNADHAKTRKSQAQRRKKKRQKKADDKRATKAPRIV